MPVNILRGERIHLRAIEPGDLDFLYAIENDPEVWQVGNTLVPYSRYQLEQYILTTVHDLYTEKQLRLMIDLILPGDRRKTIGVIDLHDFDPAHKRAGVGIFVNPEEQRKGYAYEALLLMIQYGFEVLKLHMFHCNIATDNTPSIRLFRKAGFIQCGLKKEWRASGNGWTDELMFQLINV